MEIDKNIHMIWIAGAPPESITRYAHAYKNAYPNFNFNLWVDQNSMSAYFFNKEIKEIAFDNAKQEIINLLTPEELKILKTKTDLTLEFNEKLKNNFEYYLFNSILQLQDAIINYSYTKGLLTFNDGNRISFLREVLNYNEEKIKRFEEELKLNKLKLENIKIKLTSIFGNDKLSIKDITELPEMKQVHSKHNYQREINLRGNYAAATDQLRTYILKNHGGIYTDCDVTPSYTPKVYKTIQDNSNNFDFLEKEKLRRAVSDELLSLVSGEQSAGIKNQLSTEDKKRLDNIISKISKEEKIFSPIETKVIRDSIFMSKRHQWWGDKKVGMKEVIITFL
ncbi:TPA: TcdA/TcdB catalytic glycosyltransferase domain-containing protein [Providencia rettgeri]